MKRIARTGSLLKKIYRIYSQELLALLEDKGFTDLRPSFLEILTFICENNGPVIKEIGLACGLKKQTMTSHLNELEQRGYINRKSSEADKREQQVFLTEYGQKFRFNLLESMNELEEKFVGAIGQVELERIELGLSNWLRELSLPPQLDQQQLL